MQAHSWSSVSGWQLRVSHSELSPVWVVLVVEWSELVYHRFFDLFEKYGGYQVGHLKLKRPKQLQEVLDIARFLLAEVSSHQDPEIEEKQSKLEQLKAVLEMLVLSFDYFEYNLLALNMVEG